MTRKILEMENTKTESKCTVERTLRICKKASLALIYIAVVVLLRKLRAKEGDRAVERVKNNSARRE